MQKYMLYGYAKEWLRAYSKSHKSAPSAEAMEEEGDVLATEINFESENLFLML